MFRRTVKFATLLGVVTSAPYLVSNSKGLMGKVNGAWERFKPRSASSLDTGEGVVIDRVTGERHVAGTVLEPKGPTTPKDLPLEGLKVDQLPDVLRFDITPNWVYDRWSRKSTALADIDLYGIRVPLVTGTRMDDIAGSLTYYFNNKGTAERITFRGRTGDTRKLVDLLTNRFGFRVERPTTAGEQLFQVRWNGKPTSELRIRPASVVWANSPHASFDVDLVLQRPGSPHFLGDPSPTFTLPNTEPDLPRPK